MKKYWPIALMFLCLLAVTACDKDDDDVEVDEVWKLQNEEAFQAIASDPAYTELKSLGNDGSIYYKVLKEGDGTTPIFFTDTVSCYYTGKFVDGKVFNSFEPPYQSPVEFGVSTATGIIEGWSLALQYMHIGDRWEVWIPQQLAYGRGGNYQNNVQVIAPYSTLHFEIEVVEIINGGEVILK